MQSNRPHISWLEGMLDLTKSSFFRVEDSQREGLSLGVSIGRTILYLYMIEVLLKYHLDNTNIGYDKDHNLLKLFNSLPRPMRRRVATKYKQILNSRCERAWDIEETPKKFLEYLGDSPLNDARYFWKVGKKVGKKVKIPFFPDTLDRIIAAILIELHSYPVATGAFKKKYDTTFQNLEESWEQRK